MNLLNQEYGWHEASSGTVAGLSSNEKYEFNILAKSRDYYERSPGKPG